MSKAGSFKDFVFREHRTLMLFSVVFLVLHFLFLKVLFPNAIVIGDGHHYVRAAMNHSEISAWPIGYPKFLEWVHVLTKGDWAIFFLQYIMLEGAVLWCYFTVRYFLRPGEWISLLMLFCLLVNPFILFISNYVLSDGLFAALTVLWFTLILWYIYDPKPTYVYLLIILMFLLFAIRYFAIFYPLITVPLILFSRVRRWVKLSGLALGGLLFIGFRNYTENLFERSIGQRTFSPISGWQLAGNALIMYRHIPHREADIPPPELQDVHRSVLRDLDSLPPPDLLPDDILQTFFMWNPYSPLVKYNRVVYGDYITTAEIHRWAAAGRLYHAYGAWLIERHPFAFLRWYVGQGVNWFIHPKVDITNVFPEGGVEILDETKEWFGYHSSWSGSYNGRIYSITYFPTIVTILNLLFILSIAGYFFCGCYKNADIIVNRAVIFVVTYWLANFSFIIFFAPAMLRFALSTMIFNIVFMPALLERIWVLIREQKSKVIQYEA